jgi:hypothetical protein
LRVPVVLPAPLPPTLAPQNQIAGAVLPSSYISVSNGQYRLTPNTYVGLVWGITPNRAFTRVDFFLAPTGTGTTPTLIGSDVYMGDGISLSYYVPPGITGYLSALAYYGSGIVGGTAQSTFIYADSSNPPPVIIGGTFLDVSPHISLNNNTYVVQSGQNVMINWEATFPAQTLRVDFFLIPPTGVNGTLLGTDYNLADGAEIMWISVPPGTQGTLRAVAAFSGGYEPQASSEFYVVTETVQ